MHHIEAACSQSHNLFTDGTAELIISHDFISSHGMEEGGQDSERTRAMRQGEGESLIK